MESLLVLLLIANLAGLFLIWQRQDKQDKYLAKSLEDSGRQSFQINWIIALNKQTSQSARSKRLGSGCQRPFARSANGVAPRPDASPSRNDR